MPTYEFRCPKGHEFTRFFKTMSSAAMQLPCRECTAVAERQLSAGAGLVFKGSGFYLTDYGKNAHRGSDPARQTSDGGEKKGDAKAPAESGAKSESKSESKAESKSESKPESRPAEKTESKPAAKSESREPKSEGKKAKSNGRKSE